MATHDVDPNLEYNNELGLDRTPEELAEDRRQLANSSESILGVSIFNTAMGIIEFTKDEVVIRVWRSPMLPMMGASPLNLMSPLEVVMRTETGWEVEPHFGDDEKIYGTPVEGTEHGCEEVWEYGVLYFLLFDPNLYTDDGRRGTYRLCRVDPE